MEAEEDFHDEEFDEEGLSEGEEGSKAATQEVEDDFSDEEDPEEPEVTATPPPHNLLSTNTNTNTNSRISSSHSSPLS
jgi:hypothetical protein